MCTILYAGESEEKGGVTAVTERSQWRQGRQQWQKHVTMLQFWDWLSEKSDKDDDEKKEAEKKKKRKKKEAC